MIPEEDTQRQQIEQIVQDVLARNNIQQGGARNVLTRGAFQSPIYSPGLRGWKIDSEGKAEFNDIWVTGMVKTVSVGESIQDAINTLNSFGGGVIQLDSGTHNLTDDITLFDGISLNGAGIGNTILDFGGLAKGVKLIGTSSVIKQNVVITNMTIQNSNNTAGLDIEFADFFRLENIRVHSCDQKGIRIRESGDFLVINCRASNNTDNGFEIIGTSTRSTQRYTMTNCLADSNGGIGYSFQPGTNYMFYGHINSCRSQGNTGDGFDLTGVGASALLLNFTACIAINNGGIGFDSDGNCQQVRFLGCQVFNSVGDAYEISGTNCSVVGCSGEIFDLQSNGTFIGNVPTHGTTIDPSTVFIVAEGTNSQIELNLFTGTKSNRRTRIMQNTSGGSLVQGDVVIFKSVASGDQVTTTTTAGDNKVYAMAEESIANNAWGLFLIEGFTTKLKVDGTTDIAIGDYLSCFTTAKIAQKASAGHMVFAIALEAYTNNDSNGVIDALIISPRLI